MECLVVMLVLFLPQPGFFFAKNSVIFACGWEESERTSRFNSKGSAISPAFVRIRFIFVLRCYSSAAMCAALVMDVSIKPSVLFPDTSRPQAKGASNAFHNEKAKDKSRTVPATFVFRRQSEKAKFCLPLPSRDGCIRRATRLFRFPGTSADGTRTRFAARNAYTRRHPCTRHSAAIASCSRSMEGFASCDRSVR